jgi:hypothetical protein
MTDTPIIAADAVKLVDCAGCGQELLGESMEGIPRSYLPEEFQGHSRFDAKFRGRPYCAACVAKLLAVGSI